VQQKDTGQADMLEVRYSYSWCYECFARHLLKYARQKTMAKKEKYCAIFALPKSSIDK